MKLPIPWLHDFVDVRADARAMAERLADCGFEVAAIEGDTIDFEITANRPDCLTIAGLAREVATAFNLPLRSAGTRTAAQTDVGAGSGRPPGAPAPQASSPTPFPVSIDDEGCGRYVLGVADVRVGPSPAWLAERLLAAGVRPINNVVDVTNYVMLEVHPMHAFDLAKLRGPELRIRLARAGETIVTLDGQTRPLDDTMLVVADRDRPEAIAGVMGGAGSEVSETTTRVTLESAWWQPAQVRRTSRRLALKTEAGARFERGMDISGPVRAMARALELLEQIGAGRAAAPVLDLYPRAFPAVDVALDRGRLKRLLGDAVPDEEVVRILSGLGFTPTPSANGWQVRVPSFRVDVRREADLIEEVGRHWGFNRIPATFPALHAAPPESAPGVSHGRTVRRLLTAAGLQEAVTFTFIEQAAATPFAPGVEALVAIANPLSEKFAVLRPSLLPGLLDALVYSHRRETPDAQLFECGSVFGPEGERHAVGWLATGARGDHWSAAGPGRLDFFDAKGVAELLARAFGATIEAETAEVPWFIPGRTARVVTVAGSGRTSLGTIGQVRPELAAARGFSDGEAVVGGEIDLDALAAAGARVDHRVQPLPRFPSIVRDLSIVVDERLPAAAVRGTIRSTAPPTLVALREFDRYQGAGVPEGRVSLSIRLTFRAADRTLTDAEVQQGVEAIVDALARAHGAVLRGQGG